jgi:death-on-curing protein
MDWTWIAPDVVRAIHDRQIAEHGGGEGIRDAGLLDSALARPKNLASYATPDAAELAAAYAFGLAKNHAFVDGNKRTAWVCARLFLRLNSIAMTFSPFEAVARMEAVASGAMSESELASWFRTRIV